MFTQRRPQQQATNWDRYYQNVPATAHLTRKYTVAVLVDAIKRFVTPGEGDQISIMEIGGANSCFLDAILRDVRPKSYDVVDTNAYGLSLLAKRAPGNGAVRLYRESVLDLRYEEKVDLVYSVGLIEHFDPRETRKAVLAHFNPLRPGGIAIISFPTPTLLYRLSRAFIEFLRMWGFPDERPLEPNEVLSTARECGDVIYQKVLWPLMLTQYFIVVRKQV